MSRQLSLSAALAAGAVALGMGLSGVPATAATKSTAVHSSTTTSTRASHVRAGFHGARTLSPANFVIGVDAPPPGGHNFQYTDYFPRTATTVHSGAVIDFTWDPNLSPDAFHSATLLPAGEAAATDSQASPIVKPEEGSESPPLFTPFTTIASFPNPPPGAPGGCGDPTTPCTFDGTGVLSSGATGAGSDFFVKVTANPSMATTFVFHCRVHGGMQGSFMVVPSSTAASDPTALAASAAAQWLSDTEGILTAEAAASHGAYVTNADGTHHITITAGVGTQFVEALEMLPQNVRVAPGDWVTWKLHSQQEIHTVTFPTGHGSDSVDPFNFPPMCEPSPDTNPDTVANTGAPPNFNPPPTWCSGGEPAIELPLDPAPHGPTTISSPSTVASSGVLGTFGGLPDNYTFTFSNVGTLHYQCRVHDNMTGTIFVAPSPTYWNVASDGGIFSHPPKSFAGSMGGTTLNAPVVGMSAAPDPGYVLAGSDGGVFALGDATFHGSMGGVKLNQPVVGISETPSGAGYRMVASDGGVFAFGDGDFHGSMGGKPLNAPMVGIATTPSGHGYWTVASDGGVFSFGDADFHGSMGGTHLNKPVVGIAATPSGLGYWLVASDGGVFAFGDAKFHGSMGGTTLNKPVVGIASDLGGMGYWLSASDGGIFAFGDAPFMGSEGALTLNKPVVGIGSL